MAIAYRKTWVYPYEEMIIEVCDCNLDIDMGDQCFWFIPGTVDYLLNVDGD